MNISDEYLNSFLVEWCKITKKKAYKRQKNDEKYPLHNFLM